MDWIRRIFGGAATRQARRGAARILTVAGAVVIAVAAVACGNAGVANNVATSTAGSNSSGPGCSTQGVGGDSVPPACASSSGASTGGTAATTPSPSRGIQGPVSPPVTPAPSPSVQGPDVPSGTPAPTTAPAALPQVTAVSPASGVGAGGDAVAISGSGFTGATGVYFGSSSSTMTVVSDTQITATSPPGSGTVDITVVTPGGTSATSAADQFSYQG
jgi:hypothetical protein